MLDLVMNIMSNVYFSLIFSSEEAVCEELFSWQCEENDIQAIYRLCISTYMVYILYTL